ncbi:MAG TPA: sulfite exporter TauE/SafE family protein [Candidatus Binatia bacterium]|nr:sulfite exporter TauE/SafE family protein [Candidatus Binatia bacterium]
MSAGLFLTLFSLAGLAGFGAGFIGLGGGLLLFPLLLYLPPYLGFEAIDARTVAALVISQVFFAGLIGGAAHWRKGRVHKKLTLVGAIASAVGSFLGGIGSKWVAEWFLLFLFGIVTIIAGAVMFLPGPSVEQEQASVDRIIVPPVALAAISLAVGIVVGLLGAGNFLFIPLLIYVLKIPTRITIGSSLVIHVLNGFSGFIGKLITGQVPLLMTAVVIFGASLGALVGEKSHSRASPKILRYAYAGIIAIVALRVWISLLSS